jgi:hypothetical protein
MVEQVELEEENPRHAAGKHAAGWYLGKKKPPLSNLLLLPLLLLFRVLCTCAWQSVLY